MNKKNFKLRKLFMKRNPLKFSYKNTRVKKVDFFF